MYSFKLYYTEPLFKILSKNFPRFTSTKYAKLICVACVRTMQMLRLVNNYDESEKLPHLWILFADISTYLLW